MKEIDEQVKIKNTRSDITDVGIASVNLYKIKSTRKRCKKLLKTRMNRELKEEQSDVKFND